ncbi:hypothetical protein Barb7_01307 [Bacteroidales bacterium Barb7]|nr:hypothetical protein Barb7_01307 [Bacteroidales bacterium Barb7]
MCASPIVCVINDETDGQVDDAARIGNELIHVRKCTWLAMSKKQSAYKPGSVPSREKVPAIYLVLPSPISFSGLPPGIGRATL